MDEWFGLLRSLVLYWRPGRQRALKRLYRPFVGPGDLVFDVGAHLGDRAWAFAALGAHVIALEPQPRIASWLKCLVGGNERITVRAEAAGSESGRARLAISHRTPTVSTLAHSWRRSIPNTNPGFRDVRWQAEREVVVTTLDRLIETYGTPRFCKIDVEGYELEVLRGLSEPVPGLSIEFVSGSLPVAVGCVRRLEELGAYEFNAVLGEERSFVFDDWQSGEAVLEWLEAGAGGASSGDLYARLGTRPAGASSASVQDGRGS